MTLEIVFWDVQHGSATYIKTPNGKHIVQDLGTGSYEYGETFSPLLHLRKKYGVSELDWVIITHPHKDHIDDIMNFDKMSPKVLSRPNHLLKESIMENVRDQDEEIFDKYFEIDGRYNCPVSSSNNLRDPNNAGGLRFQAFFPRSCDVANMNNQSIVSVLSYASQKVILPGDNEPPSWKELLNNSNFVNAIRGKGILLAPHHGRESGFYEELFECFTPYLTVVSDGKWCDTSATPRYSSVSEGWKVFYRTGQNEKRYCLTTRKDGYVAVKIGYYDGTPFIRVTAKGS